MRKVSKQKVEFEDGFTMVHFTGVQQSDYALCGQDLAGDSANFDGHGTYPSAQPTSERVDCDDCLRVVAYCKSIRKHDF